MKQSILMIMPTLFLVFLLSSGAQAQNYSDQQNGDYQQQNRPSPHYQGNQNRWQRTHFNYFKASMGSSRIDDYSDLAGDINFDRSSVLPINLAYGVTAGNIAFEAELGFSFFNYGYSPALNSPDPSFDGDLGATKLMFNGMYKTSQTSSNLYIGAGLGLVAVSIDGLEDELAGSALATQFILGGELRSNERSGIFIEYRQFSSVGLDLENAFTRLNFDFNEASFNLGFRYYF